MGGAGVDTRFHEYIAAARLAGVAVGVYALFRPDSAGILQAQHFLATIAPYVDLVLRAVDVERVVAPQVELTKDEYAIKLAAFVLEVQHETGELPVVYTSQGEWSALVGTQQDALFSQCELWVANYTTAPTPALARCWDDYLLWQFSSSGSVDGITGRVDLNRPAPFTAPVFSLYTPFEEYVVTSRFNDPRDYSYAPHRFQLHEGEDGVDGSGLGVVYCGRAGKVVKVGYDARGYGNYCIIDFGGGWRAWYAHFAEVRVNEGQQVAERQPLGVAGSTGASSGVHCHLTLTNAAVGLVGYVVADVVNPAAYLANW